MSNNPNSSLTPIPEKLVQEFFNRVWNSPHELDAID